MKGFLFFEIQLFSRQRISQDEEDINSILNWYKLTDAVFLDYLSQDIKLTNSSAVWRYLIGYKVPLFM